MYCHKINQDTNQVIKAEDLVPDSSAFFVKEETIVDVQSKDDKDCITEDYAPDSCVFIVKEENIVDVQSDCEQYVDCISPITGVEDIQMHKKDENLERELVTLNQNRGIDKTPIDTQSVCEKIDQQKKMQVFVETSKEILHHKNLQKQKIIKVNVETAQHSIKNVGEVLVPLQKIQEQNKNGNQAFSLNVAQSIVKDGGRKWNRQDSCLFCKTLVTNFTRHLIRNHSKESSVAQILAMPKGSKERKIMFNKLKKKGNFFHNTKCIRNKFGQVIVCQRPSEETEVSKYVPCKYCFGFFSRIRLYRHVKYCKDRHGGGSSGNVQSISAALLKEDVQSSEELEHNLLLRMKNDDITAVVRGDRLICEFGSQLLRNYKSILSSTLRELGSLLLYFNKTNKTKLQLDEFLKPENFTKREFTIQELAGYNKETGRYNKPLLAKRLRRSLHSCADILQYRGIISNYSAQIGTAKQLSSEIEKQMQFGVTKNGSSIEEKNSTTDYIEQNNTTSTSQNKINQHKKHVQTPTETKLSETSNKLVKQSVITKKRKVSIKRSWTVEEKSAVLRHFQKHIILKKVPNKEECDRCLLSEPSLHSRSWRHVKFFVKNVFNK